MTRAAPRRPRPAATAAIAIAAALSVSACAPRQAARAPRGDAAGETVMVTVGGARIAVTPPVGFCVDRRAMARQAESAFVLIEDCAQLGKGERSAGVNGLVTLSLGSAPLFDAPARARAPRAGGRDGAGAPAAPAAAPVRDQEEAFEALEDFLRTAEGRATAGMGGRADQIQLLETKRVGDTLYVLVEDKGEQVVPFLGQRFWRSFTEVRDRAAIASLGVVSGDEMAEATMLAHLASVVVELKRANGDEVSEAEARLARGAAPDPAPAPAAAAAETDQSPTANAPPSAPRPSASRRPTG